MNKAAVIFIISTLVAVASNSAQAFDGKRKGFLAGIGIGAHTSNLGYKNPFVPSSVDSEQKIAASFSLGYGFSNRAVVFVGGKGGSVSINNRDASLSVGGFGATFYLSEQSPSVFLTGLIGGATVSIDEEDDRFDDEGDGWLVGIGIEVTKGLHLELSHARADLSDPINSTNNYEMESTFATLQYNWY